MTDSSVPAASRAASRAARRADRRATRPWSQRAVTLVAGKNPRGNGANASLGQGMELAITVAIFLGIGAVIDASVGTWPIFTIALTVFAMAGASVRMWFDYDATMKRLEAERAAAKTAHQNPTPTANPQVSPEKGQP